MEEVLSIHFDRLGRRLELQTRDGGPYLLTPKPDLPIDYYAAELIAQHQNQNAKAVRRLRIPKLIKDLNDRRREWERVESGNFGRIGDPQTFHTYWVQRYIETDRWSVTDLRGAEIPEEEAIDVRQAVNEFAKPEAVLQEIAALAARCPAVYPAIKLCVSCRSSSWHDLGQVVEVLPRHSVYAASAEPHKVSPLASIPAEVLGDFNEAELLSALDIYRQEAHFAGELSASAQELCQCPLLLRLVAQTWAGKALPEDLNSRELWDAYWKATALAGRTGAAALAQQMAFEMFENRTTELTLAQISRLPAYSEERLAHLVATRVLFRENRAVGQSLKFSHERLLEYALSRSLLEKGLEGSHYIPSCWEKGHDFKPLTGAISFVTDAVDEGLRWRLLHQLARTTKDGKSLVCRLIAGLHLTSREAWAVLESAETDAPFEVSSALGEIGHSDPVRACQMWTRLVRTSEYWEVLWAAPLELAAQQQVHGQAQVRLGVVGLEGDARFQGRLGFVPAALMLMQQKPGVVDLRAAWGQLGGGLKGLRRFVGAVHPAQQIGQIGVKGAEGGVQLHGLAIGGLRLVELIRLGQHMAEIGVGFGIVGVKLDGLSIGGRSLLKTAQVGQGVAQVVVEIGDRRLKLDGSAKQPHRLRIPSTLLSHQPQHVNGRGMIRDALQDAMAHRLGLSDTTGTHQSDRLPNCVDWSGVVRSMIRHHNASAFRLNNVWRPFFLASSFRNITNFPAVRFITWQSSPAGARRARLAMPRNLSHPYPGTQELKKNYIRPFTSPFHSPQSGNPGTRQTKAAIPISGAPLQ